MKTKSIPSTCILLAGLTLVTLAACSKNDRKDAADTTKATYQDTKAAVKETAVDAKNAMANGWDNLKSYTFEKRNDFTTQVKAKQADFEAEVSKLRANYSEAEATASRKAAMAELKSSEANYKEKMAAVGDATADTWGAARDNVIAAWDRLQASYANARAGN